MKLDAFFLLFFIIYLTNAENYILTAPQNFRPSTEYKFAVTIYGVESVSYQLEAGILTRPEKVLVQETFNVTSPGNTAVFSITIPAFVPSGKYTFRVNVSGDVNFTREHEVKLIKKTHSLFIQTDKFLYKPGQTVLFRVLGIQSDLKPYIHPLNITIYDHSGNKIYQKLNQRNESGVIVGHLTLSDITSLGKWKIQANSESLDKKVFFEVAEYVLPKYEVKVILPNFYIIHSKNPAAQAPLHITITATYTFGKPVKGYALVTLELINQNGHAYPSRISKNVQLTDGKADITLPFEELEDHYRRSNFQKIVVHANVTEEATGIILQGNSAVPVKTSRYQLEFLSSSSNTYKPGFLYRAHIKLSQVDDSKPLLSDIKLSNGTFKSLQVTIDQSRSPSSNVEVHQVPISANGYMYFEVPIPDLGTIWITASFFDEEMQDSIRVQKQLEVFYTRDKKYIQLSLVGAAVKIRPKSELKFNVKTSEPISQFHYQILGKGGIHYSNSYFSETPSDNITATIFVDEQLAISLAPEATVLVSCVTSSGELVADSTVLSVVNYIPNKVSLSIDRDTSSPGEEIVLRVNASEDSYVSLLAVDQSVLLLSEGNEITHKLLYRDLKRYSELNNDKGRWSPWLRRYTSLRLFDKAGVFILTNYLIFQERRPVVLRSQYVASAHLRRMDIDPHTFLNDNMKKLSVEPDSRLPQAPAKLPETVPRKFFPETWIWSDLKTGSDGSLMLKYKVPDTITSWIATAFATNTRYGLGISQNSAKVTVIKPFFMSLNLPYSIVRGEEFALQVTIFNYFGQDLMVDITLARSNYFQVKECVNGEDRQRNEDVHRDVFVGDNDIANVYFWIVPKSLGQIPIEVKAFAGVAADSMIHNLLVKPEGQQQSYSSSALIRIPSDDLSVINFEVTLPDPDVLVSDSVIIEATLIGDIMGTTINNLDKLLKMPHGCGEQNMITLAPDVYIIKYLEASNQLTDEISSMAHEFINAGYQRELTFQRSDGSFSAFGINDPAGSVWLSAFVIKVFNEAKDAIPFDEKRIARTLTWILQHQIDDGSFSEPPLGRIIHTDMQGGSSSGISLTAYVLISLLVNRNINVDNLQAKIDRTVSFLERQYESYSQNPYILSIVGYSLYLASSPKVPDILERLHALAVIENGMMNWHKAVAGEETASNGFTSPYKRPQSNDIEMTSYVLLIYASQRDLTNSIPIAKWLISKRSPEGAFMSTQDTVLGLEALALFGQLVVPPVNSPGIAVQVTQDVNDEVYDFVTVNRDSALLLQLHQLPSSSSRITFSASGEGLALVQMNVKYHIKSQTDNRLIRQSLTANASDTRLDIKICINWLGTEESGMVLTEVNLLTGYTLSEGYEGVVKETLGAALKKQEFNNNRLSIYLDELTSTERCLIVKSESIYFVNQVKPALVKTYRYYAPGVVMSGYYSPTSTSSSVDACSAIFDQSNDHNNAELTNN